MGSFTCEPLWLSKSLHRNIVVALESDNWQKLKEFWGVREKPQTLMALNELIAGIGTLQTLLVRAQKEVRSIMEKS